MIVRDHEPRAALNNPRGKFSELHDCNLTLQEVITDVPQI